MKSNYGFVSLGCNMNTTAVNPREHILTTGTTCSMTTEGAFSNGISTSGTATKGVSESIATFSATPIILIGDTSTTSSSSSGLSTGAKIAIGVCVPVGVLIIAAVLFIVWHRRNKRSKAGASSSLPAAPAASEKDAGTEGLVLPAPELAGNEPMYQRPELETKEPPVELPNERSPSTPQAELPGDFGEVLAKKDTEVDYKVNVENNVPPTIEEHSERADSHDGGDHVHV